MNTTIDITTSVAERAAALIQSQIGMDDMAFPRLYVGQPGSGAVQAELAPAGSLYLATDKDDPEPVVVYKAGQNTGVRVHLLTLEKVWCFTDDDGNYRVVAAGAVRRHELAVPDDVDGGYQLVFCVPQFDAELPVSALFKVTAVPTAKKILTTFARAGGAPWSSAFELTTAPKSNDRGHRWFIPLATVVKAQPRHVAQAAALAELLLVHRPHEITASLEEVDEQPRF
jgi:hypothetical protein